MPKSYIVTIDGPCAAGKTSTAKELAKQLNCMYLDTGALFRAFAYVIILENYEHIIEDFESGKRTNLNAFAHKIASQISATQERGEMHMYYGTLDITPKIRSNDVSDMASRIAVIQAIREKVLWLERKITRNAKTSIIAEGRDTGSVVFPKADVKIFLTADQSERAARRLREHPEDFKNLQDAIDEICVRDNRDTNRPTAPLRKMPDMHPIDNTCMSFEMTVDTIAGIIAKTVEPQWQAVTFQNKDGFRLNLNENTTVFLYKESQAYVANLLTRNAYRKLMTQRVFMHELETEDIAAIQQLALAGLQTQLAKATKLLNETRSSIRALI